MCLILGRGIKKYFWGGPPLATFYVVKFWLLRTFGDYLFQSTESASAYAHNDEKKFIFFLTGFVKNPKKKRVFFCTRAFSARNPGPPLGGGGTRGSQCQIFEKIVWSSSAWLFRPPKNRVFRGFLGNYTYIIYIAFTFRGKKRVNLCLSLFVCVCVSNESPRKQEKGGMSSKDVNCEIKDAYFFC